MFATPIPLIGIYTERCVIRPAVVGDAKLMHQAMSDSFSDLNRWMPWAHSLASLNDTEEYLHHAQELWLRKPQDSKELPLQIFDHSGAIYYGATGFKPQNILIPSFEIGYWVNKPYTGQGLITEAMNALTRYLIDGLGAKRVEINCEPDNIKSSNIPQKLGFTLEGVLKNSRFKADQRSITDSMIFACYTTNILPSIKCDWQ